MKKVVRKEMVQINRNDLLYLKVLKNTFNHIGIRPEYYSLNGYGEEAVCVERKNRCWLVYNGERGNKYNIKLYSNIYDACLNLILRLSESSEEQRRMENYFRVNLNLYKRIIARNQVVANRRRAGFKLVANTERKGLKYSKH